MDKIIKPFLYNDELKFNELQKSTGLRSNKLAYYLKQLLRKGTLEKEKDNYRLSDDSIIPFVSEKQSVLPVILVSIKKDNRIFLVEREKRPFKGKLGLPGGRLLAGESISDATKRIAKKFFVKAKFNGVNSISLEHVKNGVEKVHSFLLILVSATADDNIDFVDVDKVKRKIIGSDYWLIKNKLDDQIKVDSIVSSD